MKKMQVMAIESILWLISSSGFCYTCNILAAKCNTGGPCYSRGVMLLKSPANTKTADNKGRLFEQKCLDILDKMYKNPQIIEGNTKDTKFWA